MRKAKKRAREGEGAGKEGTDHGAVAALTGRLDAAGETGGRAHDLKSQRNVAHTDGLREDNVRAVEWQDTYAEGASRDMMGWKGKRGEGGLKRRAERGKWGGGRRGQRQ